MKTPNSLVLGDPGLEHTGDELEVVTSAVRMLRSQPRE